MSKVVSFPGSTPAKAPQVLKQVGLFRNEAGSDFSLALTFAEEGDEQLVQVGEQVNVMLRAGMSVEVLAQGFEALAAYIRQHHGEGK